MADTKSATTITTDIKDYEVFLQTEEQADVTLSDIKKITFTHTDSDGNEEEIPLTKIYDSVPLYENKFEERYKRKEN